MIIKFLRNIKKLLTKETTSRQFCFDEFCKQNPSASACKIFDV